MGKVTEKHRREKGATPLDGMSRGQRKRLAKKANIAAKKSFVEMLTKKDAKRKKKKRDGMLSVEGVDRVLDEVSYTTKQQQKARSSETKGVTRASGGKRNISKKVELREELDMFKQISSHPAFQQMGGLNAIKLHLQNTNAETADTR